MASKQSEERRTIVQLEMQLSAERATVQRLTSTPPEIPFQGCMDGACIVRKLPPGSVHTNGGCHCHEDKTLMRRLVMTLHARDSYMRELLATQERELVSLEETIAGLRLQLEQAK